MPKIAADGQHLTVLNLFSTDAAEKQVKLLAAMRQIVDTAAYEGWMSSTVHAGQDKPGTANFIQWRSTEDLESRYAGEEFKHRTLPLFGEITTSIRLLQNEIAFTQQKPELGGVTEISPDRDDYTSIELFGVLPADQEDLIDALGESQTWLVDVPGYRTHTVLRGLRARGLDGKFVVVYSQWDSKEAYDAFRSVPQGSAPRSVRRSTPASPRCRPGRTRTPTGSCTPAPRPSEPPGGGPVGRRPAHRLVLTARHRAAGTNRRFHVKQRPSAPYGRRTSTKIAHGRGHMGAFPPPLAGRCREFPHPAAAFPSGTVPGPPRPVRAHHTRTRRQHAWSTRACAKSRTRSTSRPRRTRSTD